MFLVCLIILLCFLIIYDYFLLVSAISYYYLCVLSSFYISYYLLFLSNSFYLVLFRDIYCLNMCPFDRALAAHV